MVYDGFMVERIDATISKDGRLFIPASFRHALELPNGGRVELALDDNAMTVIPKQLRIKEALKKIHASIPQNVKDKIAKRDYASDELIQERRKEAQKEAIQYGLSTDD